MQNELFFITLIAIVAMVFGYSLHLGNRTLKLEKKNGSEQKQINKLKEKIKDLELEIKQLREAYQASQKKLKKYQINTMKSNEVTDEEN